MNINQPIHTCFRLPLVEGGGMICRNIVLHQKQHSHKMSNKNIARKIMAVKLIINVKIQLKTMEFPKEILGFGSQLREHPNI